MNKNPAFAGVFLWEYLFIYYRYFVVYYLYEKEWGMCGLFTRLFGGRRTNIAGRWVMESTAPTDMLRGFVLFDDGTAMSMNDTPLQYEKWCRSGNLLILTGRTMCGQNCLEFTETMRIKKLTRSDMILNSDEHVCRYTRSS